MPPLTYRRRRAPAADGAALIDPPPGDIPALLESNHRLAIAGTFDCQGLSRPELQKRARGELLAAALAFTGEYLDVAFAKDVTATTRFVLAGHQPELFHAGVWFKNFLLSAAGARPRAVAINLIVDTDTVHSTTIRVPVRSGQQVAIENVAYDAPGQGLPFEEQPLIDKWLFNSFAERVLAAYNTCLVPGCEPYRLLVEDLWRAATGYAEQAGREAKLGLLIARARHWQEWQLWLSTLEVPLSSVARTSGFRWFALHLLAHLPRLRKIYNAALAEYRLVNHIRSAAHPVPALQRDDDWLEAPFLLWTKENPRRRHAYVLERRDSLILSDRGDLRLTLDLGRDGRPEKAIEQLAAAEARGIKLRPRALITTMYARLVLSDLFIHGIGGAKYDELTDAIIRRFFGVDPPAFATATATFRLPIERPQVTIEDVREVGQTIRNARYRPEALLNDPRVKSDAALREQLAAYAADKREYLARHDLRRCSHNVFARLDAINRAMHDLLRPIEQELRAEQAERLAQLKQAQLLGSREFSFVLFPSEILPARLLDLCKVLS
jgi:hypothetical protein